MKTLTVTVPCYNSEKFMGKCIKSLLKGGDRVEIIIIDDGSTDATGEIADVYARQFPDIIKVVHQENGGHGEGINQGIAHATGKYFKVVDSDDWMSDDFERFVNTLENNDADLVVTNYYYEHSDGKGNRSINYSNALREGVVHEWKDTKSFRIEQLLTIHSCTFRTELFRDHMKPLPKHIFYEDNLMVFQILPYVRKLLYLDIDLYRYYIGREGQSVQKETMIRRYEHQIIVSQRCFESCHLDNVTEPKLKKYLFHELYLMLGISAVYARLNQSDEADARMEEMWKCCRDHDRKWADKLRSHFLLYLVCMPGQRGRSISNFLFGLANKVVRFN